MTGLSLFLLMACGDSGPPCPATVPELELGTGNAQFIALTEGQTLNLERGNQGGCHLPLAFSVAGLNPRRIEVNYRVVTVDDDRVAVELRQLTRFVEDSERCERNGFNAFVNSPWELEGRRIRLEIGLVDEEGRQATAVRELVVGPAEPTMPGGPNPCGPPN